MKWVTRSHVHVDRVACPWLITRFIDSEAEFIFVPDGSVKETAAAQDAIPFDVKGVELGHRDGKCSFESIIEKYGIANKAVLRMAKTIHAADIEKDLGTDSIAPGLEALATGYSLLYPEDRQNILRQFEVYDALYAWCRLETGL